MITATGQTFQHRETLKGLRGKWNPDGNCWQFDRLTPSQIATLRGLVGVMVSEDRPGEASAPAPRPRRPAPAEPFDLAALVAAFRERDERGETDAGFKTAIYGDNQQYFNHFKDKNPAAFFGFSSLPAMAGYIERLPPNKRRGSGWDDMGAWSGGSMDDAFRIARDGWAEGIEQAEEILQILNVEHATQRKRSYSVAGGQVNVGKMLTGNPMHMIRRPKQPGRKIVTLFVEASMSASINAESMKIRAVIIAALAEILEREGYSCEIVATDLSITGHDRTFYQLATTLKAAGERLNLFDAIFGLGHPAFLRRFSFASLSSADECRAATNGIDSQGSPSVMFNDAYPTARNEFYIKPLQHNIEGDTLRETVIEMLPFIEPSNLPVKIRNT